MCHNSQIYDERSPEKILSSAIMYLPILTGLLKRFQSYPVLYVSYELATIIFGMPKTVTDWVLPSLQVGELWFKKTFLSH